MLFFILLATAKCNYLHQYFHKSPALDNQCTENNTIGQNYFIGEKYFYNYITQNGNFTDLSKLSFILWVKFTQNNPFKESGRQILFQLVDGSGDNPFVNIQLSIYGNILAVYNGYVTNKYTPQVQLTLSNIQSAKDLSGWNQIVLSIDQSNQNSFINLKIYDSLRKTNNQFQGPKINGTFFNYLLSQQTRITNEALNTQQRIDQRACGYIANFEYYIGWVTMDTEQFLEYESSLVFYLKPTSNVLDQISENQISLKSESGVVFNNDVGLKIYKNTRVEYVYKNQMDSFIFSFWMNPNIKSTGPINPNYQLFSFTDDSLLKTAIGLGINNKLQLLLYQNYNTRQLTQLKVGWTHVLAYFVQNGWDNDFNPLSKKQVYIFINGTNITNATATPTIEGIFEWSRIVVGLLFRDLQDENYVIVQEMKIFSNMTLQKSQFGCVFQAAADNSFCILCDISLGSSNPFCQEDQAPISTQQYLCPQGQYKSNGTCVLISVANCSRYDSGACTVCNYGYSLSSGECVAGTLPSYQNCSTGASTCNITTSLGGKKEEIAITCQSGYIYLSNNSNNSNNSNKCTSQSPAQVDNNCNLYMTGGCYNCNPEKSLKTSQNSKKCVSNCSQSADLVNIFDDNGTCKQICPKNATYSYDCKSKIRVLKCLDVCPEGWAQINEGICVLPITAPIVNEGIVQGLQVEFQPEQKFNYATLRNAQILFPTKQFDPAKSWVQYYQGCQGQRQNISKQCISPCGVCFALLDTACLTCQNQSQFLDRQTSSCVDNCDRPGYLLRLNNYLNMTCEQKCPYGSVQQNNTCNMTCILGYTNFFGVCVEEIPLGYFLDYDTGTYKVCPQVCKSCVSATECKECIGTYPMNGKMCVSKCPYYLDFETKTCVDKCQPTDKVFETEKLNGFDFKICFKTTCGYVQANKRIPTVAHQTDNFTCRQPCDDGYYADLELGKCVICKFPCKTCQNQGDFCLTCETNNFFYHNGCFDYCPDMFKNYITWECVGGCDSGYTIDENDIKACIKKCGDAPYDKKQLYSYNQYCYEKPNPIGIYCDDNKDCFDCHQTCYTCNGPNSDQCQSCTNLFLYQNTCVDICPDKLHAISTTWECQSDCPVGTYTMQGEEQCLNECPKETFQYNGQCYNSQQTLPNCNKIEETYICYDCYSTCEECTDRLSTSCTQCKSGFYLYEGTCKSSCPKLTYKYEQKEYIRHHEQDEFKKNGYYCVETCPGRFLIQEDQCVSSCGQGFIQFDDWITQSHYCGKNCPIGKYYEEERCKPCFYGCATCFGYLDSYCHSCSQGYYLQPQSTICFDYCPVSAPYRDQINNSCVDKCPDIGFINQLPEAIYCVKKCPSYSYGKLCLNKCPQATWANGYECRVCAKNCISCSGDLISQCSSCLAGNYLDQTTCVAKCPSQRPFANQIDKKCVEGCSVYTYFAEMLCLNSCPSYLYRYELVPNKYECVQNCYSGSYISDQMCVACDPKCIQCYAQDANSCIVCADGNYLNNKSCGPTCPYFKDEETKKCVQTCPPTLYQNDATKQCLTSCPKDQFIYQMTCTSNCPESTFLSGEQCLSCHPTCKSCQDETNANCQQCIAGYFKDGSNCTQTCSKYYNGQTFECENSSCPKDLYLVTDTKYCLEQCPPNYYRVKDTNTCIKQCLTGYYSDESDCVKCDDSCSECDKADKCTACSNEFALYIFTCLQLCEHNLFKDFVNRKCQSICPSDQYHYISYGKYFCQVECPESTYYSEQYCVDKCPFGTYSDINNVCNQCSSSCIECKNKAECTSCQPGLVLTLGSCARQCGKQVLNTATGQCVDSCPDDLLLLNKQCLTTCPSPNYFVHEHSCITSCPNNTYRNGQDCVDCAPECETCVGPTNSDCNKCKTGYYKHGQNCITTCPEKYYQDTHNSVCTLKCNANLFEYEYSCNKICPALSYFEKCVDTCPPSAYIVNHVCLDCNPICKTCNEHSCLSCISGYYLYLGACSKICPNFYDQTKSECVDQCDTKLVTYMDQCLTSCPTTPQQFYQFNQVCLIACPDQSAILETQCVQCQERCLICSAQTNCLKCEDSYFLFNGSCVIACPLSFPYSNSVDGNCVVACPDGTFYNNKQCVSRCPKNFYIEQCVDKCPDGYFGDDCSPCKSQCKTCTTYQTCTSCDSNYFLEQNTCDTQCPFIYDTIKWECTDNCDGLQLGFYCYSQCPNGSYQQGNQCQQNCLDGYYNLIGICTQCPRECSKCTSATQCQSCSISYYLNNQDCLSLCPRGLFSNPKTQQCVSICPKNMFQYQTQCLFSCPKGYYANINKCTQNCDQRQIQIGTQCQNCPLECEGCTGITNNDCIKCSSEAQFIGKQCVLKSCVDGYQMVDNQCQQCSFECITCKENKCLTCRANRQLEKQCKCQTGYYDNGVDEECQQCPCDECTSVNNCTKCKNNLQTPNCSCDRQLDQEWCITCDVGRVNIQFSYDLSEIIVDFGYLISINLLNPFQPSNCSQWFINYDILGIDNQCYLMWNRSQVIIQLGKKSTINIGDQLIFQQNFYKDVNDLPCYTFISKFIDNTVYQPIRLIRPYIEFDNPQLISPCIKTNINQISIWGTGQRELQILDWRLEQDKLDDDHFFEIDFLLSQMDNILTFEINQLKANSTYIITARYINLVNRVNTTTFKFFTNDIQKPYTYLTFNPLTANAYIFDCYVTYQNLQLTYTLSLLIQDLQNNTLVNQQLTLLDKFKIQVNESLLPKGQILKVTASVDDIIIYQNVTLQQQPFSFKFKKQSRFLGMQGAISARGIDPNINDKILNKFQFNYQWLCTNLHNLEPCKSQQNQIIKFPDDRILQISVDSPNTTFAFYCNASKENGWIVAVQKIVITNLNIESDYVENVGKPIGHLNPNDDVFILLKQPQQYAMIMYDNLLIGTVQVFGQGLQFKLANYFNSFNGSDIVTIYLIPSNDSMKYQINNIKMQGQLQISPEQGQSLDEFQITMNITNLEDLDSPLKYGFFYYFNYQLLEQDVSKYSNVNGMPLRQFEFNNSINALLSNGIGNKNVFILCQIIDDKGAVTFFSQSVKVIRRDYTYKQLINSTIQLNQNFTPNLQSINVALEMLKSESKQVCLKQCSGVGTCIQGKCQCPPGYYFDDCSGSKADNEANQKYITDTMDHLFNIPFGDDQSYKLFINSLSYLTTYQTVFDKFNSTKASIYLGGVINNMQERIEKINQLNINLQYKQLNSFQYDSLDINQIIQMNDLKQTMQCHNLVWYNLLKSNASDTKYQLQYQTRQSIQNIMQLTLFILQPEEYVDFSGAGGKLLINRTSNISSIDVNFRRILAVKQQYDVIQAIYIQNLYSDDGYFPYPDQIYPLYDYSIRLAGRSQNIKLQYTINYTFQVDAKKRFTCITRNTRTLIWEDSYCKTDYFNKTIHCNCTILAPTTIVDDKYYIVSGQAYERIKLPNIIALILFIQSGFWLIIMIIGIKKDKQTLDVHVGSSQSQIKYGYVRQINKSPSIVISWKSLIGDVALPDQDNNTSINQRKSQDFQEEVQFYQAEETSKVTKVDKYSLQNFYSHHSVLNIIYKYKKFQPRWFRAMLLLMRWTLSISLAGLFTSLQIQYEVSVYLVLGVFLFSRIIETVINQQFKQTSFIDSMVMKILYLIFILFMLGAALISFWIFYTWVDNQTDWILSYIIAYGIDTFLLDAVAIIANKYLGEEAKKSLRKQAKKIKQLYLIQKQNKLDSQT